MNEGIPLCTTCGHNHVQGTKCPVCGHVGKSQIFSKMRVKSNERRSFKTILIDDSKQSQKANVILMASELSKLCCEYEELSIKRDQSENLMYSYVLGLAGDLPTAVVRFRLILEQTGMECLVIDRVHVSPDHRRSGMASRCILTALKTLEAPPRRVSIMMNDVPDGSWIEGMLRNLAFSKSFETKRTETLLLTAHRLEVNSVKEFLQHFNVSS